MATRKPPGKFAVIGLGRFGLHLARDLAATDAEVIAIDRQTKLVEQLRDVVTLAVRLDSTDEDALKAQGVHEVDVAVVGIGDDLESAAVTVAVLKTLGIPHIIARAENEMQARILTRIGADQTVSPERESALRWAHRLMLPSLLQYIELGEHHSIISLPAPAAFHHKTLLELDMRNAYGVNLIAIERGAPAVADATGQTPGDKPDRRARPARKARLMDVPSAGTRVLPEDVLILVGTNDQLAELPRD
ncbi:MAG: NAD-binding protein [Phycisphaerae bacterium]